MIEIITGDLFNSKEKYICHQCNCFSKRAAHLAKDMFDKFPYADVYSTRIQPDQPGTISIKGNGTDQRFIVNLFGQVYPGKPKYPNSNLDGYKAREKYFHQCLLKLAKVNNLESVAFPFRLGCGAADGNWEYYYGTIQNFAKFVYSSQGTKVVIYRRENDE